MVQRIQAPDGSFVEFPDGTPDDTIVDVMKKNFPAPQAADKGTSQLLGLERGLKIPLDNAAVMLEKGLNYVGVPTDKINKFLGQKSSSQIRDEDIARYNNPNGPKPGVMGTIAGSLVSGIPLMAATRNPFILGGLSGAAASEAPDAKGVVADTATGAVLGKAGDIAVRGAGAVIAPKVRPAVNYLLSKGVKLTPGQIVGGGLHKAEDAATSSMLPFVSDAQTRSLHTFNKAVVNEALSPIGAALPDNVPAGHQAVATAQDAFDQAYNNIKPKLTLMKDQQWDADTLATQQQIDSLPQKYKDMFAKKLADINGVLSAKGAMSGQPMHGIPAPMSGQQFKDVEETLGKEVKDWGGANASGPEDRKYSEAVRDLQGNIRDLAQRSNPHYADLLSNINDGYAMLTRVEKAAANTKDGVFTPSQFRQAVVNSDNSIRRRVSAGGGAMMQDLATAGETVLPRTIPESGTVPRAIVNGATAAALFGGGAALHVNPLGIGAIAAGLAPYTRTGGALASKALTARPAGAMAVRRALQASAPAVDVYSGSQGVKHRDQEVRGAQ